MPPRPDWPPRYANVPVDVIKDDTLPLAAFRLYCKLRALAWGQDTLALDFEKLMELTGLSRTRLYGHASALRQHTPLRWRVRSGVFECTFGDPDTPSQNPEKRDSAPGEESRNPGQTASAGPENPGENAKIPESGTSPGKRDSASFKTLLESQSLKTKTTTRNGRGGSKIPESGKNPGKRDSAGTRAIQDEYVRLLGYRPDNWAEGEARAAKAIGEKYTLDQFRAAYQHYKGQSFWKDKRLTLRYLAGQLPEFLANGPARRREDPAATEAVRRLIEEQERARHAARTDH